MEGAQIKVDFFPMVFKFKLDQNPCLNLSFFFSPVMFPSMYFLIPKIFSCLSWGKCSFLAGHKYTSKATCENTDLLRLREFAGEQRSPLSFVSFVILTLFESTLRAGPSKHSAYSCWFLSSLTSFFSPHAGSVYGLSRGVQSCISTLLGGKNGKILSF